MYLMTGDLASLPNFTSGWYFGSDSVRSPLHKWDQDDHDDNHDDDHDDPDDPDDHDYHDDRDDGTLAQTLCAALFASRSFKMLSNFNYFFFESVHQVQKPRHTCLWRGVSLDLSQRILTPVTTQ